MSKEIFSFLLILSLFSAFSLEGAVKKNCHNDSSLLTNDDAITSYENSHPYDLLACVPASDLDVKVLKINMIFQGPWRKKYGWSELFNHERFECGLDTESSDCYFDENSQKLVFSLFISTGWDHPSYSKRRMFSEELLKAMV